MSKVTSECSSYSQALWIVPFTMLVFGLETTLRALHRKRFQHQRKWHVLACVSLTIFITVVTWIPSNVSPKRGECLASIIWWTAHYSKVGLVIGSGLMFTFLVCASIITAQLLKTTTMDRNERIAASRVVYYFVASTIMLVWTDLFPGDSSLIRDRPWLFRTMLKCLWTKMA